MSKTITGSPKHLAAIYQLSFDSVKLSGIYDYSNNTLVSAKWTPSSNEGVYLCTSKPTVNYQEIASSSIGRLPESDMKTPLEDINSLVTYNTAIFGIQGIGKSCLTFVLKKLAENDTKIICIDIANQYTSANALCKYIDYKRLYRY